MVEPGKRDLEKEQYWRKAVTRFVRSGLGPNKFCQQESLKPHELYYWRRVILKRDAELKNTISAEQLSSHKEFVPVVITPHTDRQIGVQPMAIAEIAFLGGSMRLFNGISEETLRSLVQILKEMAN